MSRTNDEAPSNFPHWVALGSLAFVLWLSFSNLVPAMRERGQLHAMRAEFVKLREDYDVAIQEARLGLGPNAHFDLQALLIAIDQKGYTPFELAVLYPEPAPPAAGDAAAPAADAPNREGR